MAPDGAQRRIDGPRGGERVFVHAPRAQVRITASGADERTVLHVEAAIARAATFQDGVMSREQLLAAGLGRGAIRHRLDTGEFTRLFRGVFAIGRIAVSPRGWARAALLAVGPDAVLSHRSAAFVWGLADPPPTVHVSVPGRRLRPRPNLAPHTVALYLPNEVRNRDGLRVTSPLRTLRDLRRDDDLERLAAEAHLKRLAEPRELAALVPGHAPTRSKLERAMRRIVNAAGLPQPLVNHHVAGRECDFVWPRERVVAETDGWGAHGDRRSFEDDRARDAALAALGYIVVRFTWRQLVERPLLVAARLAQVLAVRVAAVPG
jgi:very-short-patch-repair endonuclease